MFAACSFVYRPPRHMFGRQPALAERPPKPDRGCGIVISDFAPTADTIAYSHARDAGLYQTGIALVWGVPFRFVGGAKGAGNALVAITIFAGESNASAKGGQSKMPVDYTPDSFALLRAIDSDSIDVTITDPPYDRHCQANQSSGTAMAAQVKGGKGGGIPRIKPRFDPLTDYAHVGELLRITRRWVVVFCTVEAFGLIREAYPATYVRGCIWYKPNSMGQLTGDRPATAYEGIAILHRVGKRRWNGRGSFGLWTCNGTRGERDRHPNQKPIALCLKLVALFSERGETVLDPFSGSGRIGEACACLGRAYIGLDNDPVWVAKANERIEQYAFDRTDTDALGLCLNRGEVIE